MQQHTIWLWPFAYGDVEQPLYFLVQAGIKREQRIFLQHWQHDAHDPLICYDSSQPVISRENLRNFVFLANDEIGFIRRGERATTPSTDVDDFLSTTDTEYFGNSEQRAWPRGLAGADMSPYSWSSGGRARLFSRVRRISGKLLTLENAATKKEARYRYEIETIDSSFCLLRDLAAIKAFRRFLERQIGDEYACHMGWLGQANITSSLFTISKFYNTALAICRLYIL